MEPDPALPENNSAQEKEAVRLQAAALVAQQAALIDQETRLRQRQATFQQHEAQIAAHLDEKQWRLAALEEISQEYFHLLDTLACRLADERLRLIEQCERLATARCEWESDHEAGAEELQARAERLRKEEVDFDQRAELLFRREAEAHQLRLYLENWQARLTSQTAAWAAERERWTADLQSQEALSNRLSAILAELPIDGKDEPRSANSEGTAGLPHAFGEARYARMRQEMHRLQGQHDAYERQVAELNAEVEHLARLLMDESAPIPFPIAKAA